jgi:hypothetical protein
MFEKLFNLNRAVEPVSHRMGEAVGVRTV